MYTGNGNWATLPPSTAETLLAPDLPALVGSVMWGTYNVQTGAYLLNAASNEMPMQYKSVARLPVSYFGPEELANQGSR